MVRTVGMYQHITTSITTDLCHLCRGWSDTNLLIWGIRYTGFPKQKHWFIGFLYGFLEGQDLQNGKSRTFNPSSLIFPFLDCWSFLPFSNQPSRPIPVEIPPRPHRSPVDVEYPTLGTTWHGVPPPKKNMPRMLKIEDKDIFCAASSPKQPAIKQPICRLHPVGLLKSQFRLIPTFCLSHPSYDSCNTYTVIFPFNWEIIEVLTLIILCTSIELTWITETSINLLSDSWSINAMITKEATNHLRVKKKKGWCLKKGVWVVRVKMLSKTSIRNIIIPQINTVLTIFVMAKRHE